MWPDTGPGIPEGEQGEIFNRFYRGTGSHGAGGSGLGLYLAREILTRQGGYIKVSSPAGSGQHLFPLPAAGIAGSRAINLSALLDLRKAPERIV